MKTAQEYIESLRGLKRELYVLGEKVENAIEHPMLRPSLNALARTYELAHDLRHTEWSCAKGWVVKGSTALPA